MNKGICLIKFPVAVALSVCASRCF